MSGSDILREVEESIRVEKAARFWNENAKTIIIIVTIIILGTLGQSGWVAYKKNQNEKSTAAFLEAFKSSDPISTLKKISSEHNGVGSTLAGLNAAVLAIDKKDWNMAIDLYRQVSEDKFAPKSYKDLALIQMVSLQLDYDEKATGADLLKSIEPVLNNKKSPWNARAIFTSSIIKSEKNNDLKAARSDLQILLGTQNLPSTFLEQVKALDEIYRLRQEK